MSGCISPRVDRNFLFPGFFFLLQVTRQLEQSKLIDQRLEAAEARNSQLEAINSQLEARLEEQGRKQMEEDSELGGEAGDAISEIRDNVSIISEIGDEISEFSEIEDIISEISKSRDEIGEEISEISEVSDKIRDGVDIRKKVRCKEGLFVGHRLLYFVFVTESLAHIVRMAMIMKCCAVYN
jgi:hypothetical protein